MLWAFAAKVVAGQAASGIARRLGLVYGQALLESLFLLFLVVVGFRLLRRIAGPGWQSTAVMALPKRKSFEQEWGTGFAIGWSLCLAAVLPALLTGHLHGEVNRGASVFPAVVVAVMTFVVASLAEEAIFRGYPFDRLSRALTPAWAALVMSLLFAVVLVAANPPRSLGMALLNETLFGLLLAMAYMRTHALWVGWGLHFGYRMVMGVLLGLPITGHDDFGALMDSAIGGPRWLSGSGFGLDAALLTSLAMLVGMAVLYRATRDWAWAYTLPEIVPGGCEVTIASPAAHVAMEKTTAVAPPPLIQIMPVTSTSFSAVRREDE